MRRRSRASPGWAPRSSRSTSSRSTRRRGCFTRGHGSPSVTSPCARSWLPSPESLHPVTRQIVLAGAHCNGGRRFRRLLSARGAAARARSHLPLDRCAGAADGAHDLRHRASARRSDRAQQPARHLHQLRQSARPVRSGRAVGHAPRRYAVRHNLAGARGRGRGARGDRPRISRTRPACRSARSSTSSRRWHADRPRPLPAKSRSPSSARISPACRSTANCARPARG